MFFQKKTNWLVSCVYTTNIYWLSLMIVVHIYWEKSINDTCFLYKFYEINRLLLLFFIGIAQHQLHPTKSILGITYCWWFRNPANQLRERSFFPSFNKLYIFQVVQAGCLPSTVSILHPCSAARITSESWLRITSQLPAAARKRNYWKKRRKKCICIYQIYVYFE